MTHSINDGSTTMDKPKPARKFEWKPGQKLLIVSDESGKTSLMFSIIGLPVLGFQAQKFMAGERAKLAREEDRQRERTGWLGISAPAAQTVRVQTMRTIYGDRIVLIFDPDTDGEFPIALDRDLACKVGEVLISAANAGPSSPQASN